MGKRYALHSLPEWVLCSVAAVSLCANVLQGFRLPEAMYEAYVPLTILTALFLAILFVVGYSRRTVAAGIPILVIAAVVVLICSRNRISFLESENPEENTGLWYLVVLATALAVYLLSRTTGGSAVLCILGALANAWICLSLYPFSDACLIIFLVSALAIFSFCRYKRRVLKTSTRKSAYPAMLGISCAAAVISVLCASLIWFLIIAPLNPPVKDVKLINNLVSLEVMEKIGISKVEVLMNEDLSNQKDEDFERMTDETEDNEEEELQDLNNDPLGAVNSDLPDVEIPKDQGESLPVRYVQLLTRHTIAAILLTCLLVLLIAAAVALFVLRHRLWLNRLKKTAQRDKQVDILYHRLRKKLQVIGMAKSGADTPLEYARRIEKQTALLDRGGPTWLELSEIFSRLCYGFVPVSDEEYESYLSYYSSFFRRARRLCGVRYLWRQFRL